MFVRLQYLLYVFMLLKFINGEQVYHKTSIKLPIQRVEWELQSKVGILSAKNRGYRILSKWGWRRGKGLDKNQSGIKYPFKVPEQEHRKGFGTQMHRHRARSRR